MAEIAVNSSIGKLKELDLFSIPQSQGIVERVRYVDIFTTTSDVDASLLEFTIPESGQDFIDFKRSKLQIKCKITNGGAPLTQTDSVGPVNLTLQSLFSNVDMFMNNVRVASSTTNYAYQAYFPTTICLGLEEKETYLMSQMYAKDEGDMDDTATKLSSKVGTSNSGLLKRASYFAKSKVVQLSGPLYTDLWRSDRWIIPNVTTKISLTRNNDKFVLMATKTNQKYHVEIVDARFIICYCTLYNNAYLAQEAALSLSPALYPLTKTQLKNYSIEVGSREKTYEDVFSGKIPSRFIVGFVSDSAYDGHLNKNPYNFKNFNINFIGAYYNGIPVPGKAYEPTFNGTLALDSQFIDCYEALCSYPKRNYLGNDITRDDFANGYCFFVFDIEQLGKDYSHLIPLYKSGNLRLVVKFKDNVKDDSIQMLVHASFPYILKINKQREIMLEY